MRRDWCQEVRKCDKCEKVATVHLTEIADGDKIEKNLCEACAAAEGITVKGDIPISKLLEDFILQTTVEEEPAEMICGVCGGTFAEFREAGLLGCPHDYDAFEDELTTLIERAQQGAAEHVGKVPRRSGGDQKRQNSILKFRAELRGAIAAENYELAASLRDKIKEIEGE